MLEARALLSSTPAILADINPGSDSSNPASVVAVGSSTYFTAYDSTHGRELWKSNGTVAGTMMVSDIIPGNLDSNPGNLTNVNGTLYFTAKDGLGFHGIELWKSDGTAAGTMMIKDIFSGGQIGYYGWYIANSSYPSNLTNVNGILYFLANDGTHGKELWRSDGTASGTTMIKDIFPGGYTDYYGGYYAHSSSPTPATVVNGNLFFTATDGVHGRELWKSDGTAAGTVMVGDILPGTYGSDPSSLANVNGMLYFYASDGVHGRELWKSDGTEAGTVRAPGVVETWRMTSVNGTFFFARDGVEGVELWKSDGTVAGTKLVKDLYPGETTIYFPYSGYRTLPNSSSPNLLRNFNGTLFFTATDGVHGKELWTSDGTAAGTVILKDIHPGLAGSLIYHIIDVNGTLYFSANDGIHGRELWKSDGTSTGTVMVEDIHSSDESRPWYLTNADGTLYFTADDGIQGRELWTLVEDMIPELAVDDATVTEGHAGTQYATFTITLSDRSTLPVTVSYTTANGTATGPSDYTAVAGTLTFAPGEMTKTVTVAVKGDRVGEPNENFFVKLSSPTNAVLADFQGTGTIIDDEPRISISDVTKSEGKKGKTTLFTFTVTLSAAYDQPVTMSFRTVDSTAMTSDGDYVANTGTLTFNPGETTKTITITIKGDTKREANETLYLDLFGLSSNALFSKTRGIGTILNDD
jgi:ELWxxDGT repeat protein